MSDAATIERPRRGAWIVGWLLLTVLLGIALRSVPWREAAAALADARPAWVLVAVAAHFLILPLGAWQWMKFLPVGWRIGFRDMFWIRAVTSTVANGGPFLAGYAASVHLLATRGGIGYDTGTSVKVLDQVSEGVGKLAVVAGTMLVVPLPASFQATATGLVLGVPALTAVALLAARRASVVERWAADHDGKRGAALDFLARVAGRLEAIRRPRAFGSGILLVLLQKAVEGLAIWAVVVSLGVSVPGWGLLLVLAAVNLSTMISVTPANLGIYEGSAFAAYRIAGVPAEAALALAVLQHLTYLVPMAGTGWVLLAAKGLGHSRDHSGDARDSRDAAPASGTEEARPFAERGDR